MFHFYLLTFSSSAQTAVISLGHNCVSVTMWAAPFEVFLLWLSPKPQPWSKNPSFIHLSSGLSQFKKTPISTAWIKLRESWITWYLTQWWWTSSNTPLLTRHRCIYRCICCTFQLLHSNASHVVLQGEVDRTKTREAEVVGEDYGSVQSPWAKHATTNPQGQVIYR